MEIEFWIKILGGISAALAIGERAYTYSRKIYLKIKSKSQVLEGQPALPHPATPCIHSQLETKKSYLFYILECRSNFAPQLTWSWCQ